MQKRFLIVKLSALGDIIQAFPVAEYLKDRYPDCEIDWVVKPQYRSLLDAYPLARGVDRGSGRYDGVFDLQGNCRSALATFRAKGTKVGFSRRVVAEWPNILVTSKRYTVPLEAQTTRQYLSIVQQFFGDTAAFEPRYTPLEVSEEDRKWVDSFDVNGAVMVCPGTKWPNKQPSVALWRALLRPIEEKKVLIWGREEERALSKQIDPDGLCIGAPSFPRLQHLMSRMKLVLAVDSFALHLAALARAPTFALFGPSNASVYNPIGVHHRFYQGTCPYGKQFVKRCPVLRNCPTGACLKDVNSQLIENELNA